MEQISKNFKLSDFERSDTAAKRGIDNRIPDNVKPAIRALVTNLLQPLCDWINAYGVEDLEDYIKITDVMCAINSGYRSPELNKAVGGVATSQHPKGEAADINVYIETSTSGLFLLSSLNIKNIVLDAGLPLDQMILYKDFVHLSYTEKRENRMQVLYNRSYTGIR